jgi:RNA-binding protein YlmH
VKHIHFHVPDLSNIFKALERIETHMATQDQQIADFQAAVTAALDNIQQDENQLLAEITALQAAASGELSPANAQKLADIVTRVQTMAASIPDLPPPAPPAA